MKKISKGSWFAVLSFLFIALVASAYGVHDTAKSGDSGGNFIFAGIMAAIALGIYLLSRRVDVVPVLLALLLASAASCTRPSAEPPLTASTYTDARGFEIPVQTTADSVRARW